MPLYAHFTQLDQELDRGYGELLAWIAARPAIRSAADFTFGHECLLEGILSRTWQAWGTFWRCCLVESCLGTTDGSGNAVAPHPAALSDAHVSAAAIKAAKVAPSPTYWAGTNLTMRYEPQWGDTDVLNRMIPRLGVSNQARLLAAASHGHGAAKALQTIRNASAHLNSQTLAQVLAMRSAYVSYAVVHPVQALFWLEAGSRDFLWARAIDDLRDAALAAIS